MKRLKGYLVLVVAAILLCAFVVAYAAATVITDNGCSVSLKVVDSDDEDVTPQIGEGNTFSVTVSGWTATGATGNDARWITLTNVTNETLSVTGTVTVVAIGGNGKVKLGSSDYEEFSGTAQYPVNVTLQPEDNCEIEVWSPEGEGTTTTLTFAPELSKIQTYNVTMGAAGAGGSYTATYGGQPYAEGTTTSISNDSAEGIALNATPNSGHVFDGWYVGEKCVSASANYTYIPSGSEITLTIAPRFLPWRGGDVAPFSANGTPCYTWETAMWLAGTGGTVVVAADYSLPTTLAGNGLTAAGSYVTETDNNLTYAIPAGVTLLVPYADARITADYMEQTPEESSGLDPWTINPDNDAGAPYANRGRTDPAGSGTSVLSPVMDPLAKVHRTLIIPATTTVRIEKDGVFSVGGVMSGGGHGTVAAAGGIIGQHSNIQLEGSIVVAGVFSCNGFVLGSGSITTESGGAIYEPFVVMDFHAGSWTQAAAFSEDKKDVPLFLRYTMPNIQADMTISYGAGLYGYCDLVAGNQHNVTTSKIIGSGDESCALRLKAANASVVMTYNKATAASRMISTGQNAFSTVGKSTLTITGNAEYGALWLTVEVAGTPKVISTADFPFTLPYNVDMVLKNGTFNIDKHFYILPGAKLTVGGGAALNIGASPYYSGAKARFAVFDGLMEHTNHGTSQPETVIATLQEYAYPKPDELADGRLKQVGELVVDAGGELIIGNNVQFGGYVQAGGANAKVSVKSPGLSVDAQIGFAGAGKYAGMTTQTLQAKLADGTEIQTNYAYTANDAREYSLTSFQYLLHDSYTNATKTTQKTQEISATLLGSFTESEQENPVAEVTIGSGTTTSYGTWNEAWMAAEGAKDAVYLKLLSNPGSIDLLTISTGMTLTLDLNGQQIGPKIVNNGTLTIVDSGAEKGKITASSETLLTNNGTLSLEGVTLEGSNSSGKSSVVYLENSKTGKIKRISQSIIKSSNRGTIVKNEGTIERITRSELQGSGFSSSEYTIQNPGEIKAIDNCKLIQINNNNSGKGRGKGCVIYNTGTITEVVNCTISSGDTYNNAVAGFAINIASKGIITAIRDCDVTSKTSDAIVQGGTTGSNIKLIAGGTYTGKSYAIKKTQNFDSTVMKLEVTGGVFYKPLYNQGGAGSVVVYGGYFSSTSLGSNVTLNEDSAKGTSAANAAGKSYNGKYPVYAQGGYTITATSASAKGMPIADVSMDGPGTGYGFDDNAAVTFTAPEVKGYTFTGWYPCYSVLADETNIAGVSAVPWSTDLIATITVQDMLAEGLFDTDGKAKLVAKYEPVNDTYVTLKLNDAPDNTSVAGEGVTQTGDSGNVWRVPVGTEVTINVPNGTNFRYWTNANDKVMSKDPTYTFTMVTNTTLTAETNDGTSTTFVIFQSADERLLKAEAYSEGLTLPAAPYRVGYEFKGWKVDGKTDSTATTNVAELKKAIEAATTATIVPVYSSVGDSNLKVTVYVDGKEDGSGNSYKLGEIAKFTAPDKNSGGKDFRFWASDAKGTDILSFSRTYSFRVTQTTTIYAIYGGENNPTAQPVVRVDNVLKNPTGQTKSLTFMIGASIPSDYELVEMGALYAKDSGNDTTLRVENVGSTDGVYKAVSRLNHETAPGLADFSYALGFKIPDSSPNTTIYLRGYVAVRKTDSTDNTIYYYYSGVRLASYNNPNGTNS